MKSFIDDQGRLCAPKHVENTQALLRASKRVFHSCPGCEPLDQVIAVNLVRTRPPKSNCNLIRRENPVGWTF